MDAFRVVYEDGGYFAENIAPDFYCGRKVHSNWKVRLDPDGIRACQMFLKRAKVLRGDHPEYSTSEYDLTVTTSDDTVHVHGDGDWDGNDMLELRGKLFTAQFNSLAKERRVFMDSLSDLLTGTWYADFNGTLEHHQLITLTRRSTTATTCPLVFSPRDAFTNHEDLDRWDPEAEQNYDWDVDEGTIYLTVRARSGIASCAALTGHYDSTYIMHSISADQLVLGYLWGR